MKKPNPVGIGVVQYPVDVVLPGGLLAVVRANYVKVFDPQTGACRVYRGKELRKMAETGELLTLKDIAKKTGRQQTKDRKGRAKSTRKTANQGCPLSEVLFDGDTGRNSYQITLVFRDMKRQYVFPTVSWQSARADQVVADLRHLAWQIERALGL